MENAARFISARKYVKLGECSMVKQNAENDGLTRQPEAFGKLRKRALESLPDDLPDRNNDHGDTYLELLQEIQIHHAELEIQNDELRRALAQLEESRERYYDLYDRAPIGYVTLDKNSMVTGINTTGLQMLDHMNTPLYGKPFSAFVARDSQEKLFHARDSAVKTGKSERCELKLVKKNGEEMWVYWECISVNNGSPYLLEFRCSFIDITPRIKSELKQKKLNKKLLKEEKQRIYLSQKLIDLLEEDRREIASYLHDHTGQILTALKMEIEELSMLADVHEQDIRSRSLRACNYVNSIMKEVKTLAWNLMPVSLDVLGLQPALISYFQGIEGTTDLTVNFFTSDDPLDLERRVETAIFRVAQEAINNIIKHARASAVYVNLVKMGTAISFSIEDNGVGFDMESLQKGEHYGPSLGLILMEERVVQLKGKITIDTQPGRGTRILVEIPI